MSTSSHPGTQQVPTGPPRGQQQPATSRPAPPKDAVKNQADLKDEREDDFASNWALNIEAADIDRTYPVVVHPGLEDDISKLLGHPLQLRSVRRVPQLGDGQLGRNLGNVNVAFLNGDENCAIKDKYSTGEVVAIEMLGQGGRSQTMIRLAFAPAPAQNIPIRHNGPPAPQAGGSSTTQETGMGPRVGMPGRPGQPRPHLWGAVQSAKKAE